MQLKLGFESTNPPSAFPIIFSKKYKHIKFYLVHKFFKGSSIRGEHIKMG